MSSVLVGADPVGVVATDDFEAVLDLDADAVAYHALRETIHNLRTRLL